MELSDELNLFIHVFIIQIEDVVPGLGVGGIVGIIAGCVLLILILVIIAVVVKLHKTRRDKKKEAVSQQRKEDPL